MVRRIILVDQEIVEEKSFTRKTAYRISVLKIDLKLYCDFFANND